MSPGRLMILRRRCTRPRRVITDQTPGSRVLHEDQLEGRRVKVSMHLGAVAPWSRSIRSCRNFTAKSLACWERPGSGTAAGSLWKFVRPGRATPPGTASWPLPGKVRRSSASSSPSTMVPPRGSVMSASPGMISRAER